MKSLAGHQVSAVWVLLCVIGFLGAPALAQNCPAGPFEGSVVISPTPTKTLYPPTGSIRSGFNVVEIPGMSPINVDPNNPNANGFIQLCSLFGLTGTQSSILQVDAKDGRVTVFNCDQRKAPRFQPCQAVVIRPAPVAASIPGQIPLNAARHEGTWTYRFYADGLGATGDNFYGIPYTASFTDLNDLCAQLNLQSSAQLIKFDAATGNVLTHSCGSPLTFSVSAGEALLIRPPSTVTATLPIP